MIINAHCHRNFLDESCVQVALYDDRLEVTSPGGLYNGLTFEEAIQGHSKLRNRAIANVFSQIGLVEAWGTGLRRIQISAREYSLPDPEFIEMPETFRVNLYRKILEVENQQNSDISAVKCGENAVKCGEILVEKKKEDILVLIRDDNYISARKIADNLSMSIRTVEKNIKELRESGILVRRGSARGGYWEIIESD